MHIQIFHFDKKHTNKVSETCYTTYSEDRILKPKLFLFQRNCSFTALHPALFCKYYLFTSTPSPDEITPVVSEEGISSMNPTTEGSSPTLAPFRRGEPHQRSIFIYKFNIFRYLFLCGCRDFSKNSDTSGYLEARSGHILV